MLTDATELTPQEEHTARSRLCHLAERLTEEGALRSPEWREVFQRTWRHPYVPRYYPDHTAPRPPSARPTTSNAALNGWPPSIATSL